MKIGILSDQDILMKSNDLHFCDKIVVIDRDTINRYKLRELLETYLGEELYVQSIKSFGLQLIDCLPLFEHIVDRGAIITFIEKNGVEELANEEYFNFLVTLAENEKDIFTRQKLIEKKQKEQRVERKGRPTISKKKIYQIRKLYTEDFKTMREIADICNVSLGTVFKYINSK